MFFLYYGARYYDPRTSVWQSPDPILNEYMSGQTNGGVFNPKNLGLFTYTYNNPVNLVDPDGKFTYDPQTKGFYTDKGDTLSSISKMTGSSVGTLIDSNPSFNTSASFKELDGGQKFAVPETKNIKAFKWAASKLGDKDYGYYVANGNFDDTSDKCNLFVSDAYKKGAGVTSPRHPTSLFGLRGGGPATAGALADMGTSDRSSAKIGDIVSWRKNYPGSAATGHTTIYTDNVNIKGYPKNSNEWGTIGAGAKTINYRTNTYLINKHYPEADARFLGVN